MRCNRNEKELMTFLQFANNLHPLVQIVVAFLATLTCSIASVAFASVWLEEKVTCKRCGPLEEELS